MIKLSSFQHSQTSQQSSGSAPHWDDERRQLRVNQHVVKKYRVPSPQQEAVLAAFQEEGWPCHIHDPLPPQRLIDPKRRLHDTIKRLNRHHQLSMIRFRGNGNGEGVCWEFVDAATLALPTAVEEQPSLRRAA